MERPSEVVPVDRDDEIGAGRLDRVVPVVALESRGLCAERPDAEMPRSTRRRIGCWEVADCAVRVDVSRVSSRDFGIAVSALT